MPKYRKKPIVIEAWHFKISGGHDFIPQWMKAALDQEKGTPNSVRWLYDHTGNGIPVGLRVYSLEGAVEGFEDIWLMKGVRDELYLCDPDIFAETYEVVKDVHPKHCACTDCLLGISKPESD